MSFTSPFFNSDRWHIRQAICLVLIACIIFMGIMVAKPQKARAAGLSTISLVASLISYTMSIAYYGIAISKYFTGGNPTNQMTQQLNQISSELGYVLSDLSDISSQLNAITQAINQIAGQNVQQLAWNYIPDLQDMYGTQPAQTGTLYGYSKDAYGTVSTADIDTLTNKIMGVSSPGATPTDPIYDAMMAFYDVLTTGPLPGVNSALYYATNVAIMDYTGSNPSGSDFSAKVESTNGVPIVAERPMYFNYNGAWPGGHDNAGTPEPAMTSYFAEGTTRPNFDSFLCLQDPGASNANVKISYIKGDGSTAEQNVTVPAHARVTVNVGDILGRADSAASDFSAKVASTNGVPIVSERPMYFKYNGAWTGGHCNSGVQEPATTSYFAEGSTRPNFDSYLCLQDPGQQPAAVKVTYMKGDGTTQVQGLTVPAHTRTTIKVNDLFGGVDNSSCDFSAKVESTNGVPIVAERPMYFNYHAWLGGHCESGRVAPVPKVYFAEGTTRPGFNSYICVQNPEAKPADVKVTYMQGNGGNCTERVTVPAHSRATLLPRDAIGSADSTASDFSATVESTNGVGILAERPMYFNYAGKWSGGHTEAGVLAPAKQFYFAEGTVRKNFQPYLCLQNPNGTAARVKITYMMGDGTQKQQWVNVPPNSRQTVDPTQTVSPMMTAYVNNIETIFVGNILYQLQAIRLLYEAISVNPGYHGYASSQAFADAVFGTGGIIQAEINEFLTSVETLALCKLSTNSDLGQPTISVPSDAWPVLERADGIARAVGAAGNGLSGRVIASQDIVPPGQGYGLTAVAGTQVFQPTSTVPASVPAIASVSGITQADYAYDIWNGQTVSGTPNWSVVRYSFNNLPPGTYNMVNAAGATLGTATEQTSTYVDPQDSSKVINVAFGDFGFAMKGGGTNAVCDQTAWAPTLTTKNTSNASVSVPTMSMQANLDTGFPKGSYSQTADCCLDRSIKTITVGSNPNGFSPYLDYEVDLSQTTVKFECGTLYDDGEAQAIWTLVANDKTTGQQDYVTGDTIDMLNLGLTQTMNFKSKYAGQMLLVKGHTYELVFSANFYVYTYNGKSITGQDYGTRCSLDVAMAVKQLQVEYQAGTPSQISSISPTSAHSDGKTQVTINGTGFGTGQGSSLVLFNGVSASVVSWSDTKIVAKSPSGVSKGSRPVVVQTATGTSNAAMIKID
jgi:hypothetical protein